MGSVAPASPAAGRSWDQLHHQPVRSWDPAPHQSSVWRDVVGVSCRTTEIDGVDVGGIERLPVDIDRETVVADQRGEVITLVGGDGLIKGNGDGITARLH